MALKAKFEAVAQELEALNDMTDEDLEIDEVTRERLYTAARKTMLRIENDAETLQRIDFAPIQLAVIRFAYDVNLFELIAKKSHGATVEDLASSTRVCPFMLSRILKFCAAHGMIEQTSIDGYAPNKMTRSFCMPGFRGAVISHRATTMLSAQALPEFLESVDYTTPNDPKNCSFQRGTGSADSFFEFLDNNPLIGESFNEYMAAVQFSQKRLGSLYDFSKLWGDDTTDETPLFVDVGGGSGHQCVSLRDSTERGKGRIILQDLPEVVADVSIDQVEVMSHSFFEEQPIKSAKVYYFRTILHDWPDEDCRTILGHVRDAMGANSVIILDEHVIPNNDAHWIAMNMDLNMMLLLAAGERSERQWTELLESTGLRIKNIIRYGNSGTCLIEVVKSDDTNGYLTNGHINGHTSRHTNGHTNGDTNGDANGFA